MWTTSSFRADARRARLPVLALLACVAASATAQERPSRSASPVAPDAPRPARIQAKEKPVANLYEVKRPVELRSVTVGRLTKKMETLAGTEFVKTATDPLFIEVKTVPGVLGKPPMTAAPVILLNGERLLSTRGGGRDTLVAFLPDREKIRDTNSVAAIWIGKQEPTMTEKPLTFRRADVKE
jgi:hypothetical protein